MHIIRNAGDPELSSVRKDSEKGIGYRKKKSGRNVHLPALFLAVCLLITSGCEKLTTGDSRTENAQQENSQQGTEEFILNEFYFDTVISIRFDANKDGEKLIEGCRTICDEIQQTFSRTDENSELYAINHRDTDRVEVSRPIAGLVQVGLDYYEISGGRFDITIAPLSDLWDFKSEDAKVPSEAEIQSALRKVDASAVHVESEDVSGSDENVPGMETQTEMAGTSNTEPGELSETESSDTETGELSETESSDTEPGEPSETATETGGMSLHDTKMKPEAVIIEAAETETEGMAFIPSGETEEEETVTADAEAETEGSGTTDTGSENGTGAGILDQSADSKTWFLRFDNEDTMIDLGALVKGYAADRIAAYLRDNGVTSGLINLGGNVYALGAKADGSAWKIGIQKPFDTGVVDTVEVTDQSVVSSGVYERCFEQDGILYHHILDPETGYPVTNGLWGVSIISDSSLTGDALSTTCLAIGMDEAADLIRSLDGVSAIFVDDQLNVVEV